MGLLQMACKTYDTHAALAGKEIENRPTLCPVAHILQKAQLEITLEADGSFVAASAVDKDNCATVIPATEKSATRSGKKPAAHPLCEQLAYLLTENTEKYEEYLAGLQAWCDSDAAHLKLRAVLNYVQSGNIVKDLTYAKLIETDKNGKVSEKDQKALIRWRVYDGSEESACWKDPTLFTAFQKYYASLSKDNPRELCLVTGEVDTLAQSHPKGIVAANYGAKLISANDSSGFTYRGRFTEARQGGTVSFLASQKAHFALQWIAAADGVNIGGRTFVCWNPNGKQVPGPTKTPFRARDAKPVNDPTQYRKELYKTVTGFQNALKDEDVILATFDAATTGRLSLTYYREFRASDYLERMEKWFATCCLPRYQFGIQSPSIGQIALFAFGTEREEKQKLRVMLDDRVYREQTERLLRCVTEGAAIPYDIARALKQRATMQTAYNERENYKNVLFTAAVVIRKFYNDRVDKEEWLMALEPEKRDCSYQYGRLLAVMEKVERETYTDENEREPNAVRMQMMFSENPFHGARVLDEKLNPYLRQLKPGRRAYFRKLLGEIWEMIGSFDAKEQKKPLGDTYILGYYLQRMDFYKSKKSTEDENDERTEEQN